MSATDFPSRPNPGTKSDDKLQHDAGDLADTARHDLEEVAGEVKAEAAALGEEVRGQLEKAAEKAKGAAEEQKQLLADQLSGVSSALGKVAGELETNGEGTARYVRMIADGAERLTSTVRYNNVDDILAMTQDFGRKQPAAFVGAAALLGFVASRFLVASASRSAEQAGTRSDASAGQYASAGTAPSYAQSVGGSDAGL